jgi:hypothetical protein
MNEIPRFGLMDLVCLLVVVGCAAGVRAGYVAHYAGEGAADTVFIVQGRGPTRSVPGASGPSRTELEDLAHNLRDENRFACLAPLSDRDEETADVAPGYPWLVSLAARVEDEPAMLVRWVQCGLGALTVLCYFFFARRAFASTVAGTIAGLLGALYPFWIVNTAELADGVLVTFLLAATLALGTRGSQVGGAFTSLLFGLLLAALPMVRAALLPFAVVAFVWYLARCRTMRAGWFAALLALLGFANGLAPWTLRNWRVFQEPVPIVDSTYLHLWMGNNPRATGGTLDEATLRQSLPPDLLAEMLAEPDQPRRYARLGPEWLAAVNDDPAAALGHRLESAVAFCLGEQWLRDRQLALRQTGDKVPEVPAWIGDAVETSLRAGILVVLLIGLLGWRLSAAWGWQSRLAALAIVWVPLPYILGHAGQLSGPRLPLDGVLLCYVAFTLAYLVPGFARTPAQVIASAESPPL